MGRRRQGLVGSQGGHCQGAHGRDGHRARFAAATALLDISKFYDSIGFERLMRTGLAQGFAAIVMALEVQPLMGPCHLRQQRWLGPCIQPQKSVVAGSAHGGKCAKVFLGPIKAAAHRKFEYAQLWTFVDDTVVRAEGTKKHVKATIYRTALSLKEGLDELHLTVSPKTVLLASDPVFGRELARGLRRLDVPCTPALQAVDLGIDTAVGRKRVKRRAAKRVSVAQGRLRRILRMRRQKRLAVITKALWSTAAQPQATYGHQAMGLAPSTILLLRRSAAAAAAGRGPGRCFTSTLAALYGDKDPVLELRRQVLAEWLELWRRAPELHCSVELAWPKLRARLTGARRWRQVRGPTAAIIALLMDVRWDPSSATVWGRPNGVEWHLPAGDDPDVC